MRHDEITNKQKSRTAISRAVSPRTLTREPEVRMRSRRVMRVPRAEFGSLRELSAASSLLHKRREKSRDSQSRQSASSTQGSCALWCMHCLSNRCCPQRAAHSALSYQPFLGFRGLGVWGFGVSLPCVALPENERMPQANTSATAEPMPLYLVFTSAHCQSR
jgi:hypothetical protein